MFFVSDWSRVCQSTNEENDYRHVYNVGRKELILDATYKESNLEECTQSLNRLLNVAKQNQRLHFLQTNAQWNPWNLS